MSGLTGQIVKFGLVGVAATLIDYLLLMLLSQVLGIPVLAASAASFTASLVFNYLASMRYVFRHREDMSAQREFATFLILSLIGLALNQLIMWVGTSALGTGGIEVTIVKALATSIVMVWNFVSRKAFLDAGEAQER